MKVLYTHYVREAQHPAVQMVEAIARELERGGHEVTVHRSAGPEEVLRGGPVRDGSSTSPGSARPERLRGRAWFLRALGRNAPMFRRDLDALRRARPDVVLARQDAYCASVPLAARWLGIPLVTYADAPVAYETRVFGGGGGRWHPPGLVEAIEAWTLRRSRAVLTVSHPAAELLGRYGVAVPIRVVPNGVDPARFPEIDQSTRAALRRTLGLTAPYVAGFVGTFKAFHGTDRLRDLILATSDRDDTQWLLVGDGPERPALERAVAGGSRVVFLGRRPPEEIGRLQSLIDVAVAPHSPMGDAFYFCPLKVLEAAAAGCAVVASAQGDIPDLLDRGDAGVVLAEPGLDVWARAVHRLLDDSEGRRALGRRARDRVMTRYTWRRTAERVGAILAEAAAATAQLRRNRAGRKPRSATRSFGAERVQGSPHGSPAEGGNGRVLESR